MTQCLLESASNPVPASRGPKDFHWLVHGRLGGAPRPGVGFSRSVEADLGALKRVNTSLLINLTEEEDPLPELVRQAGIDSLHFRIPDQGVPAFDVAMEICRVVEGYLLNDQACVFHCHGGKGRTGTMLAAQLIYFGLSADDAIRKTREQNGKWIESQEQFDFLYLFGEFASSRLIA